MERILFLSSSFYRFLAENFHRFRFSDDFLFWSVCGCSTSFCVSTCVAASSTIDFGVLLDFFPYFFTFYFLNFVDFFFAFSFLFVLRKFLIKFCSQERVIEFRPVIKVNIGLLKGERTDGYWVYIRPYGLRLCSWYSVVSFFIDGYFRRLISSKTFRYSSAFSVVFSYRPKAASCPEYEERNGGEEVSVLQDTIESLFTWRVHERRSAVLHNGG